MPKYLSLFFIVFYSVGLCGSLYGQPAIESLSIEEAINVALEKSFGLRAAQNNLRIAENSTTKGNAGMSPTVDATGGLNYSLSNLANITILNTATGGEVDIKGNGAQSTSMNLGLSAAYVLFDGYSAKNTYKKLQLNEQLAQTQYRVSVENTLLQIVNAYFEVVRLQEQLKIDDEAIAITKERLRRASVRAEFGGSNSLEVLNAKVNLDTDSLNVISSNISLDNARRNLNLAMGEDLGKVYLVDAAVDINRDLVYEELEVLMLKNSAALEIAKQNELVADLDYDLSKSGNYPRISANGSYGFNRQDNGAGQLLSNSNLGLNLGLTASYRIFDGGQRKIRQKNALLNKETAIIQTDEAVQNLKALLQNAFNAYQTNLNILRIQENAVVTAEENFRRTEESLKLGQSNTTQFREAQINLIQTQLRINQAKYNCKRAEMELLRLAGVLVEF